MRLHFIGVITWCMTATVRVTTPNVLEPLEPPRGARNEPALATNQVKAPVSVGTATVPNPFAGSNLVHSVAHEKINQEVDKAYKRMDHGQMKAAIRMFKEVLAQDPTHQRARFGLGSAYIQLQRYEDALAVLEPMVQEFPKDYLLKNNIAWLYATAKDVSIRNGAKAVQFAQDALLIAPRDFHVWSTLSEGYYISGQYDKALRAAEEALKLCLDSPTGVNSAGEYRKQIEKNRRASQAMSIFSNKDHLP